MDGDNLKSTENLKVALLLFNTSYEIYHMRMKQGKGPTTIQRKGTEVRPLLSHYNFYFHLFFLHPPSLQLTILLRS